MGVDLVVPASPSRSSLSNLPPGHSTMTAHVRAGTAQLTAQRQQTTACSAFLTGSAKANRNAVKRMNETNKRTSNAVVVYERDTNAGFHQNLAGPSSVRSHARDEDASVGNVQRAKDDWLIAQRRLAEELVEAIPIGPKAVKAPEHDPHFLTFEPNSGVKLKTRLTPHVDFCHHLDGRRYIPISTLYRIKLEGKSHDGDFTIPVDGDWIVMGVLTEKRTIEVQKAKMIDVDNKVIDEREFERKWHDYLSRKGDEGAHSDDEDNPYRRVLQRVPAKRCYTMTIIDLGQPLSNQETAGDSMVKVRVYEADQSYVEQDGRRVCKGGSAGAFESFEKLSAGTLIGLLNPLVKKAVKRARMERGSDESPFGEERRKAEDVHDRESGSAKLLCLEPRRGDSVLPVGRAYHFATCGALCKNGQRCENFVDLRTPLRACEYHMQSSITKGRNGRQEFANGSSFVRTYQPRSAFAMSDGMSIGSRSKLYVSSNKHGIDGQNDAERNAKRIAREKAQEEKEKTHREREWAMRLSLQRKRPSIPQQASSQRPPTQQPSEVQKTGNVQDSGSKAIESAMLKLGKKSGMDLPRQRNTSVELHRNEKERRTFDPLTGRMRKASTENDAVSSSTSKLLARLEATSSAFPKPMMRLAKKDKERIVTVRPPPGESFYASDVSDDELDNIVYHGALDDELDNVNQISDDDSSDMDIVQ